MDRLRLVLVGVEGPMNLGVVARLSVNFSVDELYLVNPVASLEEAFRYSARAVEVLKRAVIVDGLREALEGCSLSICTSAVASDEDYLRRAVYPWDAVSSAMRAPGTVALVMGRESVGLRREEIMECSFLSTIPASPEYPELNLSAATAIFLYEFFKARGRPHYALEAPLEGTVRLIESYSSALAKALMRDESRVKGVARAFRKIAFSRLLTKREADMILALLSRACRRVEGCRVEAPR